MSYTRGKMHVLVVTHDEFCISCDKVIEEGQEFCPGPCDTDLRDSNNRVHEVDFETEHPECELVTETCDPAFCLGGDHFTHFYVHHNCDVQWELDNNGLDGLEWHEVDGIPNSWPNTWRDLPAGRYVIQAWHSYDEYSGEYDGGVELLGLEGKVDLIAA